MNVLVRLYASYRESAGLDRVTLPLHDGAVVADAVEALLAAVPALPRNFRPHLIAVNEEFANLAYPLSDGDDVALYPPVSGGADVWVGTEAIDAEAAADAVRRAFNGAVVTFEGRRATTRGAVRCSGWRTRPTSGWRRRSSVISSRRRWRGSTCRR